ELAPVADRYAEAAQQVLLPAAVVGQDPLVPGVADRVEVEPQPLRHRPRALGGVARRAGRRQPHAALDALRRDGGGRVDANPAAAREPDLGARMRIGLPDLPVAVDRVALAALVAGDDAGRDAEGAHQYREGAGIVFAEAGTGAEQEIVDAVASQQRRLQRVPERFAAEHRQ